MRINCISPGYTKTGLTADFEKATEQSAALAGFNINAKEMIENTYLSEWNGRSARPEEMGYPLVFLGSKMASYISGQDVNISYGKDAYNDIKALQESLSYSE